jgi:conjugative transfer signal peptidase TraF
MSRSEILAWAGALTAVAGLAAVAEPQPLVLYNGSPSEPLGVYVRDRGPPRVGQLIAFRPPAPARPYVQANMPAIAHGSILKTVVALGGDRVCARAGGVYLNGRRLGPTAARDRQGRALPQWRQCRVLTAGEAFVFSARIPNSFDSRYYGPVTPSDLIGVYRPLRGPGGLLDGRKA